MCLCVFYFLLGLFLRSSSSWAHWEWCRGTVMLTSSSETGSGGDYLLRWTQPHGYDIQISTSLPAESWLLSSCVLIDLIWNKHNNPKWAEIWRVGVFNCGSCKMSDLCLRVWPSFFCVQVKPLLQVTRQDEEIQVREAELQKAKDKLTRAEQDYSELDKKHAQVNQPACFYCSFVMHFSSPLLSFCLCVPAVGGKGSPGRPAAGRGRAVCRGRGVEGQAGQS